MQKRYTHWWLLLLVFGLLSACKDEWEEINLPIPDIAGMTISESMTNDGGTVVKKEQYLYEDQKLKSHSTLQEFYGQSFTQTTTIGYAANQVVITYPGGDVATYTLGADGYATQCTYLMGEQTRIYDFTYANGYLTQVDEQIDGTPGSSSLLTYHNGDLTSIRFGEGNETLCSHNGTVNYTRLPCTLLEDIYPLSLHLDAMYAQILGKPTQHLVSSYEPVNNDPESQDSEKMVYSYVTDTQQRVTGIEQKTTYAGLVYDTSGKAHLTESTVYRSLTISYH